MSDTAENRELTFGEKFVGLTFNPSENADVDRIKKAAAAYIDVLAEVDTKFEEDSFQNDLLEDSMKGALISQMVAVKAVTFKY